MRWLLLWGCQFLLLSLAYSNSCPWSLWCLEMSQFTTLLVYLERTFIRLLTPTTLLLTELWSSVTIFLYFLSVFFYAYRNFYSFTWHWFFKTFILSFWIGSSQKSFYSFTLQWSMNRFLELRQECSTQIPAFSNLLPYRWFQIELLSPPCPWST